MRLSSGIFVFGALFLFECGMLKAELPQKCQENCEMPFGTAVGVAYPDVPVFSNCRYTCNSDQISNYDNIIPLGKAPSGEQVFEYASDSMVLTPRRAGPKKKEILQEYQWNSYEFVKRWLFHVFGVVPILDSKHLEAFSPTRFLAWKLKLAKFPAPDFSQNPISEILNYRFYRTYAPTIDVPTMAQFQEIKNPDRIQEITPEDLENYRKEAVDHYRQLLNDEEGRLFFYHCAQKYRSIPHLYDFFFYANSAEDVRTSSQPSLAQYPVTTHTNGSPEPPRFGDIIVYSRVQARMGGVEDLHYNHAWGDGHIAIVAGVRIEGQEGQVYLAEQNFENHRWEGRHYSRIIPLTLRNGEYSLGDETERWFILGWKRVELNEDRIHALAPRIEDLEPLNISRQSPGLNLRQSPRSSPRLSPRLSSIPSSMPSPGRATIPLSTREKPLPGTQQKEASQWKKLTSAIKSIFLGPATPRTSAPKGKAPLIRSTSASSTMTISREK